MRTVKHLRLEEQPDAAAKGGGFEPDVGPLLGTWVNTNGATRGISKVILSLKDNRFVVRIFGVCESSPCDWGEVAAYAFTKNIASSEVSGVRISYDFGFMSMDMQAHIKQGVLVIAKFDRFKDDSGRANYFSREFFYRLEDK